MNKLINIFLYLAIQCCAFIGLFLGSKFLPKYDDIIYPFGPNLFFLLEFYQILFPLGFLSVGFALVGSWVYEKSMLFAALTSITAIVVDYYFNLFTNLSEHYFHFSFVLAYMFGVYVCYWFVKKIHNKLMKQE